MEDRTETERELRTLGAALYREGVPAGQVIHEAERRHWPTWERLSQRVGSVYTAGGYLNLGWREAADRERERERANRQTAVTIAAVFLGFGVTFLMLWPFVDSIVNR